MMSNDAQWCAQNNAVFIAEMTLLTQMLSASCQSEWLQKSMFVTNDFACCKKKHHQTNKTKIPPPLPKNPEQTNERRRWGKKKPKYSWLVVQFHNFRCAHGFSFFCPENAEELNITRSLFRGSWNGPLGMLFWVTHYTLFVQMLFHAKSRKRCQINFQIWELMNRM